MTLKLAINLKLCIFITKQERYAQKVNYLMLTVQLWQYMA